MALKTPLQKHTHPIQRKRSSNSSFAISSRSPHLHSSVSFRRPRRSRRSGLSRRSGRSGQSSKEAAAFTSVASVVTVATVATVASVAGRFRRNFSMVSFILATVVAWSQFTQFMEMVSANSTSSSRALASFSTVTQLRQNGQRWQHGRHGQRGWYGQNGWHGRHGQLSLLHSKISQRQWHVRVQKYTRITKRIFPSLFLHSNGSFDRDSSLDLFGRRKTIGQIRHESFSPLLSLSRCKIGSQVGPNSSNTCSTPNSQLYFSSSIEEDTTNNLNAKSNTKLNQSEELLDDILETPPDSESDSESLSEATNLSQQLADAYHKGETDGVQDLISNQSILSELYLKYSPDVDVHVGTIAEELVISAKEAAAILSNDNHSKNNKNSKHNKHSSNSERGCLAGILNGILASCCGNAQTPQKYPQVALAILQIMDELFLQDESSMVAPDIVSLSLVYYSLQSDATMVQPKEYSEDAQRILERAQRMAKKTAGSQRRKALAAERRRSTKSGRSSTSSSSNDPDETNETNGTDGVDNLNPTNDNLQQRQQSQNKLQQLYGSDIHVLFENEHAMVLSKPSGVVCYHTRKTSAGKLTGSRKKRKKRESKDDKENYKDNNKDNKDNNKDNDRIDISLEDAILDLTPLSTINPEARGVVHRLDRGTSGCIVLAKTDDAHLKLVASFFLRRAKKDYLALVPACSNWDEKTDESSSSLSSCSSSRSSSRSSLPSEGVIDLPVTNRPALSHYRILQPEQWKEALLVEVETFTGRKHQVRAHCAWGLGRPVFLDPVYSSGQNRQFQKNHGGRDRVSQPTSTKGGSKDVPDVPDVIQELMQESKNSQKEKFFLHAKSLRIPEMGISVEAPLPLWWKTAMDRLK